MNQNRSVWRLQLNPGHVRKILLVLSGLFIVIIMVLLLKQKYFSRFGFFPQKALLTTVPTTTTTTTKRTTTKSTSRMSFRQQSKQRCFAQTSSIRNGFLLISELGCFSAETKVTRYDGSKVSIDSLKVGDEVQVYAKSGQIERSQILSMFRHDRSFVNLLEIIIENHDQPLRLTPTHSILVKRDQEFLYDFASNLKVGDLLRSSGLKSKRIEKINEISLANQTIWTPLTFEGNVIVNDVIGSCYATFSHSLMHFISWPLRYWKNMEKFVKLNNFVTNSIDYLDKMSVFLIETY